MQRFQSRISNTLSEVMLKTVTSSDSKSQGFMHKEAFERNWSLTFGKLSENVREEEPETAELSFPDRGSQLTIIYRGKFGRLSTAMSHKLFNIRQRSQRVLE